MQIFITDLSGETIPLEVDGSYTVDALKAKIQFPHTLTFAGESLEDHRTLAHYGIKPGSTLRHEVPQRSRGVEILVRWVETGETFCLEVESSDTAGDVKAILREQSGLELPAMLKLVFDGKTLDHHEYSLEDYGIQNGSTLLLEDDSFAMF